MSDTGEPICARAQQLVSAWLDGRLDAPRRAALQRHLLRCDACQRVVRQTERLARATHNLPPQRVAADLGQRVHAAVAARRGRRLEQLDAGPVAGEDTRRALRWRAVAIAASLVATWSIGYVMGVERATPAPLAWSPPTAERHQAPPLDGPTFVAGCRRVLRELAAIDELPQRARQPWISSQLELFELPRRAEHVLATTAEQGGTHTLATLIRDLSAAVELGDVDWQGWQQRSRTLVATTTESRAPEPLPQVAPRPTAPMQPTARLADLPPDRERIVGIVDRHAGRLDDHERAQLGALLELEQGLAAGMPTAGREFVRRIEVQLRASGTIATSFSFATASAGARSLNEAGLEQEAARLEQLVSELRRQVDAGR